MTIPGSYATLYPCGMQDTQNVACAYPTGYYQPEIPSLPPPQWENIMYPEDYSTAKVNDPDCKQFEIPINVVDQQINSPEITYYASSPSSLYCNDVYQPEVGSMLDATAGKGLAIPTISRPKGKGAYYFCLNHIIFHLTVIVGIAILCYIIMTIV